MVVFGLYNDSPLCFIRVFWIYLLFENTMSLSAPSVYFWGTSQEVIVEELNFFSFILCSDRCLPVFQKEIQEFLLLVLILFMRLKRCIFRLYFNSPLSICLLAMVLREVNPVTGEQVLLISISVPMTFLQAIWIINSTEKECSLHLHIPGVLATLRYILVSSKQCLGSDVTQKVGLLSGQESCLSASEISLSYSYILD
nr:uncharacterized protein LOC106036378 isoform X2 [Anser cygnoides]